MKYTITILAMILSSHAAGANPIQIREAKEHLTYITQKRTHAKSELDTAKRAYKAIDGAYDAQISVVNALERAERKKIAAERKALEAEKVANQYDSYLTDRGHASGGVSDYYLGGK